MTKRDDVSEREECDIDGNIFEFVEEEDDAEEEEEVVVSCHHVFGAEVGEGEGHWPGGFLNVSFVAGGHAVGECFGDEDRDADEEGEEEEVFVFECGFDVLDHTGGSKDEG